jgi:hypothetical protein
MTERLREALATYEREHEFARTITLSVEDRAKFFPGISPDLAGAYRWFKSPNIVCLEKYRRLKAAGRI